MEMALDTEWPTSLPHRALGVNSEALVWVSSVPGVWMIRWWITCGFSLHLKLILTTLCHCAPTGSPTGSPEGHSRLGAVTRPKL